MVFNRCERFVFLLPAVFILACTNDSSGNSGGFPSADYLAADHSVYRHSFVIIDSLGKKIEDLVDTVTVTVATEERMIQGFERSVKVTAKTTPIVTPETTFPGTTSVHWYAASNDTVYLIAYITSGGLYLPKGKSNVIPGFDLSFPSAATRFVKMNIRFADSIYWSTPKRAVYVMPMYAGREWRGYPAGHWFTQIRRIESVQTITTQAGSFPCYKIRTSINSSQFSPDEIWYDYVAKDGIILRTLDAEWNLSTEVHPDGVGRAMIHERLELISRN